MGCDAGSVSRGHRKGDERSQGSRSSHAESGAGGTASDRLHWLLRGTRGGRKCLAQQTWRQGAKEKGKTSASEGSLQIQTIPKSQTKMKRPAIIGIPSDHRMLGRHPFHCVGEKYIRAVRESTSAVTLLIPSLPTPMAPEEILATVDGLLFT